MTFEIKDSAKFMEGQRKYWDDVQQSGGFDLENVHVPEGTTGLMPFDCQKSSYPNCLLVEGYAKLGLHLYNMSKGKKLAFQHMKKFNMLMNCLSSYYITLTAFDPATISQLDFQVGVREERFGNLAVRCSVARPRPQSEQIAKEIPARPLCINTDPFNAGAGGREFPPLWPSDFSDTNRFYLVSESELQDNDWFRSYLELALCANDRNIPESHVSQLQILKVAIETLDNVEPSNESLKAENADVYITFKGLPVARVGEDGEHVERKVIVRRFIDESGYFNLLGGFGFSIGENTKQRPMTSYPSFQEAYEASAAEEKPFPADEINDYFLNLVKATETRIS